MRYWPIDSRWTVPAILAVALAARIAAGVWWQERLPAGERFGFGDSLSYWMLAESISRGGPLEYGPGGPRVFRTPGYPLLLVPLFWIHSNPPVLWARLEGALLGTVAVALVMALARSLFGLRVACAAGWLAALYPGAVGTSIFVLSEAPYTPLLLAQLNCWMAAWRATDRRTLSIWSVLAGVMAGLATLMRPSHLLFTPFALGVAMLTGQRRRNIVIGTLMSLSLAITMSPWWVRNYHVTGRFVATTLQLGASLYDGLNPQATGASDMRFVRDFIDAQQQADGARTAPPGLFEERLDRRMRDAALEWARREPGQVVQLMVVKLLRMWSPIPNAAEFQSWLFRLGIFVTYTPVMAAALASAWRHVRYGWGYLLCVVPAAYLTLLHIVFVSSLRYREPAMMGLIVLAAGICHAGPLREEGSERLT
ncbi:MAG: ArnT family glycosyltransferase [Pirellulaceae bacterium]